MTATAGDATVNAANDISVSGTVEAGNNAMINAAKAVEVDGDVLAKNGKADIDAGTTATVSDDGTVKATVGAVEITAANEIVVTDTAAIEAGTSVTATSTDVGDITIDTTGAVTANDGNVTIANENGAVTVQSATVTAHGDNGSVDVDATNGGVTVDSATVQSEKKNVTVDADGNITVSGTAVVTGNNVGLNANTGVQLEGSASVTTTGDTSDGRGNLRVHAADGGISLGEGTTVSAAANATVLADKGDVQQNTDITANAGTVDVEATSGSVTMADGVTTRTSDQNIRYRASGDIVIEKIDAGTGSVTLDAGGNLSTASSDSKVTADGLAVKANQVGAEDAKMKFDVSRLAVNSATGIYVDNAKSVTVTTAGGDAFKVVRVQEDFSNGTVQSESINGVTASSGKVDLHVDGNLDVANGSSVASTTDTAKIDATGSVTVDGTVSAGTTVDIDAGTDITVDGTVSAGTTADIDAGANLTVGGTLESNGNVDIDAGNDVTVTGTVEGKGADSGDTVAVDIEAGNNISIDGGGKIEASNANGSVRLNAKGQTTQSGISIGDGTIKAGKDVSVTAGGDLAFNNVTADSGKLTGGTVTVNVGGDITQSGAFVDVTHGYATVNTTVPAAIEATDQAILTAGGNVGGNVGRDRIEFVAVDAGSVTVNAGGNASIAAANGESLTIGGGVNAGGTASVYTTQHVGSNGGTIQGYDVVVTAGEYSDGTVNIATSRRLTVNNLEDGMNPGLAIFKTTGGKRNPRIANLPNRMLVFIDGRLAGGDIQMINKLGSLEAFPVQTPELKSEQGVFGNPVFLHDQLDVVNPIAIGAIDFILQDRAKLELDADFPRNVDSLVDIIGLSPTTSFWFGQDDKETEKRALEGSEGKEQKAKKEDKQ